MKNLFSKKLTTSSCVKDDGSFKIQLNDCLACSGCITDSDKLLTETNLDSIIQLKEPVTFIISSQSKWSIFDYSNIRNLNFEDFENHLCHFLRDKFDVKTIYDSSYATDIITNGLLNEKQKIISDCPGTVMYIERQAPHLINYLSTIMTAQQILSYDKSNEIVINIVQCYDKKLEMTESSANIDFILTTYEFMLLLSRLDYKYEHTSYSCLPNEQFQFNVGINSGGYLNNILMKKYSNSGFLDVNVPLKPRTNVLRTLEINNTKDKTMNRHTWENINKIQFHTLRQGVTYNFTQKSPGCFIYEFIENGHLEVFLKIIGVENLINFMKEMKTKPFNYKLVEAYICNYGCLNGPGQIQFDNIEGSLYDYSSIGRTSSDNFASESIDLYTRSFRKKEMKKTNFNVQW